jgi:hypothetical protein
MWEYRQFRVQADQQSFEIQSMANDGWEYVDRTVAEYTVIPHGDRSFDVLFRRQRSTQPATPVPAKMKAVESAHANHPRAEYCYICNKVHEM